MIPGGEEPGSTFRLDGTINTLSGSPNRQKKDGYAERSRGIVLSSLQAVVISVAREIPRAALGITAFSEALKHWCP